MQLIPAARAAVIGLSQLYQYQGDEGGPIHINGIEVTVSQLEECFSTVIVWADGGLQIQSQDPFVALWFKEMIGGYMLYRIRGSGSSSSTFTRSC